MIAQRIQLYCYLSRGQFVLSRKKETILKVFLKEKILNDMEHCYDCIYDLALYKLNKHGNEFENSHSESGSSQHWI